jgi:hypothetical protein
MPSTYQRRLLLAQPNEVVSYRDLELVSVPHDKDQQRDLDVLAELR